MSDNKSKAMRYLEVIKKGIALYNELTPEKPIALKEVKKNVKNIFICVYNDQSVGLFKKIEWRTKIWKNSNVGPEYNAGNIYVGIDSNYIGMKETHWHCFVKSVWQPAGIQIVVSGKRYVSNCHMSNGMSFDDMRLVMYTEGLLDPYERGYASDEEILEVLSYAYRYYALPTGKVKGLKS